MSTSAKLFRLDSAEIFTVWTALIAHRNQLSKRGLDSIDISEKAEMLLRGEELDILIKKIQEYV